MKIPAALLTTSVLVLAGLPVASQETTDTVFTRMGKIVDRIPAAELPKAEEKLRKLLNDTQLKEGFGSRDAVPALATLAAILAKLNKPQERDAAMSLANDIKAGLVPLSSNGEAYMRADKTLAVMRRIVIDPMRYGFAYVVLQPTDEAYVGTVRMVGGLTPGVGKLMPISPTDSSMDQAMGFLDAGGNKEIRLNIAENFNYTYRIDGERKTMRIKQASPKMAIAFTSALAADMKSITSTPEYIAAYRQDAERMPIQDRVALAFFLQPTTGVEDTYPWLALAELDDVDSEELKLLRKSFPTLLKVGRQQLEKRKKQNNNPTIS